MLPVHETEVIPVKDQGFALVYPVTLGYVCNPVPIELHVSPLSVLAPRHRAHLTLTRPCPSAAILADPRSRICRMLDADFRECVEAEA